MDDIVQGQNQGQNQGPCDAGANADGDRHHATPSPPASEARKRHGAQRLRWQAVALRDTLTARDKSGTGKRKERGKGGRPLARGLGKGAGKRLRVWPHDPLQCVTQSAIRRLARRGGVKRMNTEVFPEVRTVLREFLCGVIHDAALYTDAAQRKTMIVADIVHALKRRGYTLYGFGNVA
jgi:histone H4